MLSKEEAMTFAESVLGIPDTMKKIADSKLDFLNLLMMTIQENISFQTVSLLSLKPEDRHRPTWDEVKTAMFQKTGGLCYTLNVFMYYLLKAFRYEVFLNIGTVSSSVMFPNNHIFVIVKNVQQVNDSYLCDVGIGYPSFEAVSLDFDSESPILHHSFLEYKYVKHEGNILRMHGEGDFRQNRQLPFDFFIGKYRRFYQFEVSLKSDLKDFDSYFKEVFTNPDASPFHLSLRSIKFQKGRAKIIVNRRLMIEKDEQKFDVTTLHTDEDICKAYRTHFPEIPQPQLLAALDNWNKKMLPKEEAVKFVEDILEIEDPLQKIVKDKLGFLNSILYQLHHNLPFQSITLIAEDLCKRHRPSFQEMKDAAFKRHGGLCYTWNIFMFYVLESLGYETYLNHCTVLAPTNDMYLNDHVALFVKSVIRVEDLYLLDLGFGQTHFQVVPMDFQEESPEYKSCSLEIKYVKYDGTLLRLHGNELIRRKNPGFDSYIGRFRKVYSMKIDLTRDVSAFDAYMDTVYTQPAATPFHNSLRAIIYKNKKAVIILNSKLILETETGDVETVQLENDDAIVEAYKTHFPQFPEDLVRKAVCNWRKSNEK